MERILSFGRTLEGRPWRLPAPAGGPSNEWPEERLGPEGLLAPALKGWTEDVLRPLFHRFSLPPPEAPGGLALALEASERVAQAIAERYRQGDLIWGRGLAHGWVPGRTRTKLPGATLGFSLDGPVPPLEVLRTLPSAPRLLESLLGADLLVFPAPGHLAAFTQAALLLLGAELGLRSVEWKGRLTRLAVSPPGLELGTLEAVGGEAEPEAAGPRGVGATRLLVGVDPPDDSPVVACRLLALERLLGDHPELGERIRLIQVVGEARWEGPLQPILGRLGERVELRRGPLDQAGFASLARSADVFLATPMWEDLGVSAARFVAARADGDGVLVVSEHLAAASELTEASRVNPLDVESVAQALHAALGLSPAERRARLVGLRARVLEREETRWADGLATQLRRCAERAVSSAPPPSLAAVVATMLAADELVLLLDYDGTLVPFTDRPERAVPDKDLLALLARLSARPRTSVHVVSGRSAASLEGFFGGLELVLHAEHGQLSRVPRGGWVVREPARGASDEWRGDAVEILRAFAARTPGSFVEEKARGIAWHYRMAEPALGERMARELRLHLWQVLGASAVEVLAGSMVIELRPKGANKGEVAAELAASAPPDAVIAAVGDDRTDEDMFVALPSTALTFHVGSGPSRARLTLASVAEVRALLASLC